MRGMGALRTALAFVILVMLHYTLRPLLAWRAQPDFLLIALLLVAIRVRPGVAAVVGLIMGFVADSLALHAFGSAAMAMSLVAFSASWLKAVFFADNLALNAVFFFVGKWAFNVIYLLMERRYAGGELLMQVLVWSSLSAAVTAFMGLLTLLILRPILRTSSQ
ncbi:MAG TPA: rod shape-determining protein MreD [Gemmatimonadaceae bacterium]|nr:rod shape-determining protein MreD [Gemmatimonadaceae bacterium]